MCADDSSQSPSGHSGIDWRQHVLAGNVGAGLKPAPTAGDRNDDGMMPTLSEVLGGFSLLIANRLHVKKTVLGDVEVVSIGIGPANFRIGPSIGTRLGQFIGVNLFHLIYDRLAAFDLKAEMIKAIGSILFVVRQNGG